MIELYPGLLTSLITFPQILKYIVSRVNVALTRDNLYMYHADNIISEINTKQAICIQSVYKYMIYQLYYYRFKDITLIIYPFLCCNTFKLNDIQEINLSCSDNHKYKHEFPFKLLS